MCFHAHISLAAGKKRWCVFHEPYLLTFEILGISFIFFALSVFVFLSLSLMFATISYSHLNQI